jgi:hypothetical protein
MNPPSTDTPRDTPGRSNERPPSKAAEPGVLSSLPSTRPQRPSARRSAARQTAARQTAARADRTDANSSVANSSGRAPKKPRKQQVGRVAAAGRATPKVSRTTAGAEQATPKVSPTTSGPTQATPKVSRATARAGRAAPEILRAPRVAEASVPPQGFEAEEEIQAGHSVQPPSGSELASSLADLFGELAQASLSAGGRLLKDAFKRLPGS